MLLLETIREYAADRLEQSGQAQETRERHAGYFLALAEASREPLRGPDQIRWLDRLDAERSNVRAALEHYIASEDVDRAIRLASSYGNLWYRRSLYAEGRQWLEATLALGGEPSAARALAWNGLGNCCVEQGDLDAAQTAYETALSDAQEIGDERSTASSLNNRGALAWARGEWSAAARRFAEALELVDESSADAAMYLANIGSAALMQGDAKVARARLEQSLALRRALGDDGGVAQSLYTLGQALFELEEFDVASDCFLECLDLVERLGDTLGLSELADALALLAAAEGNGGRAACLIGSANELREELGGSLSAAMTTRRERWIDPVRDADPDAFERGIAEGVALAHDVPALLAELRQTR
jgi:non-specific serine/threonine protein kinase